MQPNILKANISFQANMMVVFQLGVGFQLDMDIQIVQLRRYDATIAVIFQLKGEFQLGVIFQLVVILQLGVIFQPGVIFQLG